MNFGTRDTSGSAILKATVVLRGMGWGRLLFEFAVTDNRGLEVAIGSNALTSNGQFLHLMVRTMKLLLRDIHLTKDTELLLPFFILSNHIQSYLFKKGFFLKDRKMERK